MNDGDFACCLFGVTIMTLRREDNDVKGEAETSERARSLVGEQFVSSHFLKGSLVQVQVHAKRPLDATDRNGKSVKEENSCPKTGDKEG